MASKEAEALIQKYGGGFAADRAKTEQIRQESKADGTWGQQQYNALAHHSPKVEVSEEKKTSADKMWDRRSEPEKMSETTRAKQEKDKAKKQHEDYFKALGAKRKELTGEGGQNLIQNNPYGYNADLAKEVQQMEQQERVLRARAEQAEKEYNEAEDRKRFETDMEVITGLPEEQRLALERYSASKYGGRDILGDEIIDEMMEEYGRPRLDELERTFSRDKNARRAEEVEGKTREFVNERGGRGLLANLASIPVNAYSGLIAAGGQLAEMINGTGGYKTVDPNAYGTIGNTFTNAVRGQTSENIIEDLGDGFVGQAANIGYQSAMSAADSVARAYLGGGAIGGATLAGTGTFSQTMSEASQNGATPAEAAMLATTSTFVELAAEKIPLDNLIRTAGGETGKSVIKNILTQAGIEIAEEEITLLANVFLEAAILQEKSNYNQTVNKYILEGGMTPEEAVKQADMDILNEAINTVQVSGLAGVMSAAAAEAYSRINRASTLDATPRTAEELKQQALDKVRAIDEQNQTPAAEPAQTQQEQQTAPAEPAATVAENATTDKTEAVTPEQQDAPRTQTETQQPVQTETAPRTQTETQQPTQQADTQTQAQPTVEQSATSEQPTQTAQPTEGAGTPAQNFTGKAEYQNLLSDDNVQRDRPGDVRPMDVPKTDSFGKRVSELVGNAYGAEVTTDKMANTIEELVQDGSLGFDVRHNQDSINKAAENIIQRGVAATRKQITNAVSKGKIRDGDVEQAILLYAMYNSKDTDAARDNASEILVDLATMANITGRNLQMFRMLRQLTPEGQVMTIKKQVQKNIDSMIQSGAVKKGYTTEIDPELMQEYRKAAQENMRAVSESQKKASAEKMQTIMDTIYAIEASKMPATMKAKWDAWRYMSMLGNVKTNVRNVAGNVLFAPYKQVKDRTAALAEKLFVTKDKRTKSLLTDPELLKWARQDRITDDVKNALKYSGKIGEDVTNGNIRENMKVFDNKTLESLRKFTEKMPKAGDMLFKNGYYARSLADFIRARGYKAADIQNGNVSAEVLNEARSYAVQEAMKATFNDANAVSDFFATGIRYKGDNPIGKLYNMAMEGVMPFRRTPANIAVRFEEYSPLGIINTMWKAVDPLKTGKYTAADVVDSLASSLTGTAAVAIGFALAKGLAGIKLTGSNPSEDDERQGHQEYAIEFADKDGNEYSYKIDWAAPSNLPLFIGANIYDAIVNNGENDDVSKFTAFLRGLGNAFEPMLALSCLSGINDLFESARYAEEGESLYAVASKAATSYFTQGIPTLLRQAAQASQDVKRSAFSENTDPTIRDIEGTLSGIPFYGEKFKSAKVNAWGETESTGTVGERILNAFVNPGTLKKIDNSALEQEISRLNKAQPESVSPSIFPKVVSYTDKDGTFHKDHRMTEEEYQKLAQTQGQTTRATLESMINSKSYQNMNDEMKAKAMKMAYSYAREKAMGETFDTSFSESWMMDIKSGKEAAQILQRTADNTMSNAFSKLNTAWDNNYSQANTENYSRELEKSYESYSKMDAADKRTVKETATGSAAKYIEAREKGISHKDFLKTVKAIKDIKPEAGSKEPNQKQKLETIARAGLSESQKVTMAKMYASDAQDKNIDEVKTLGGNYKLYTELYRDYSDYTKGSGKKNRTINYWRNKYGWDYSTAKKYYEVFS